MNADLVNALFELGGAFAIALSIRRLRRDKRVAGYDPTTLAFFTLWGFWNLWFYGPAMGAWLSWWAGIAVVAVNCAYLALLVWYVRHPGGRAPRWTVRWEMPPGLLDRALKTAAHEAASKAFGADLEATREETRRLLS